MPAPVRTTIRVIGSFPARRATARAPTRRRGSGETVGSAVVGHHLDAGGREPLGEPARSGGGGIRVVPPVHEQRLRVDARAGAPRARDRRARTRGAAPRRARAGRRRRRGAAATRMASSPAAPTPTMPTGRSPRSSGRTARPAARWPPRASFRGRPPGRRHRRRSVRSPRSARRVASWRRAADRTAPRRRRGAGRRCAAPRVPRSCGARRRRRLGCPRHARILPLPRSAQERDQAVDRVGLARRALSGR